MSEKASKGMFLKPEKLQNHYNEGKGKQKRKSEGKEKRKRKKKAMVELLVFIIATTIIAITLSKIRLDILVDQSSQGEDMICSSAVL